ncbi:probable E3 ubiquitin-protein ligase WAVH2 [Andrographis paniculata]|uniref:probable E3 ubiquitin-protein ligase WAVH2 n=1 Tax=Andrographis paniculata TaxID=175694 RepID=UPI0021E81A95|nr:probable E3 ubiquitin-protein ligase WAVH2 [Andrographis paniculata]
MEKDQKRENHKGITVNVASYTYVSISCCCFDILSQRTRNPFRDDEYLPISSDSSIPVCGLPRVRVTGIPEQKENVGRESPDKFDVLVQIKAPSMSEYPEHPLKRAPIDLVMVLDINERVDAIMLAHIRNSVCFAIDNLGELDRLSIAWSCPRRIFPLRRMTEKGRKYTKQIVRAHVFADGPTDAVEILMTAARILEQRRYRNTAAFIIILSNRKEPPASSTNREEPLDYLDKLPDSIYPYPEANNAKRDVFPVYSFGIGVDHEPVALHTLSSTTGGTYSFVETTEILQDAIAYCIGNLLAVVNVDFSITFTRGTAEVVLVDVKAGDYYTIVRGKGSSGDIKVQNLFADETLSFLIDVAVNRRTVERMESHLILDWKYKDAVVSSGVGEVQYRCTIDLHPISNIAEVELNRKRTLLLGADWIDNALKIAEAKGVKDAKNFLFTECRNCSDSVYMWILERIREVARRMAAEDGMVRTGWQAFGLSTLSACDTQRAATTGSRAQGAEFDPFGTPNTVAMVTKSRSVQN